LGILQLLCQQCLNISQTPNQLFRHLTHPRINELECFMHFDLFEVKHCVDRAGLLPITAWTLFFIFMDFFTINPTKNKQEGKKSSWDQSDN